METDDASPHVLAQLVGAYWLDSPHLPQPHRCCAPHDTSPGCENDDPGTPRARSRPARKACAARRARSNSV
ncbi:hypothetical protein [Streptomyces longispororuber]|uniref:hypothetical protein n=1 Tax=Streptomyces longispororuber TaxID=68230 RepID=UPI0036F5489C